MWVVFFKDRAVADGAIKTPGWPRMPVDLANAETRPEHCEASSGHPKSYDMTVAQLRDYLSPGEFEWVASTVWRFLRSAL